MGRTPELPEMKDVTFKWTAIQHPTVKNIQNMGQRNAVKACKGSN
jgi:hypothetical protein